MKALLYLNKYFAKYKWRLILGIIFIVITNIINVASQLIIGDAINAADVLISEQGDVLSETALIDEITRLALIAAGLYLLFYFVKGVFLFLTRMTIIVMSRLIEFDLKNEVFHHYQQLDLAFYKRNSTGDLMNRISEDVSKVRMYLGPAVMYSINLVVLFLICVPVMLYINVELTLYSLAPLPVMSVTIYYVSSIMNKKSVRKMHQQSKISTFVQEAFSGIRVLKAYSRESQFEEKFNDETKKYREYSLDQVKVDALFFPVIILLIGLSTTITIWIGGNIHIENPEQLGIGDIVIFIMFINMLTWPFAAVGWVTSLVQQAAASQERLNEFLHTEPNIENPTDVPMTFEGNIAFKGVHFTYPESGTKALRNISFEVNAGQTLAIIGRTGSGKTTITQLLARQFDPIEGEVLIDQKNVREVNLDHLRSSIGYVPQEVFLFSDTIANNIAFGIPAAERNQQIIEEAARNAGIHHNITTFKNGYETRVGERGITLSGGQKQRVSIARAIIKSPAMLVFDDSLSAVDTETEEMILSNLKTIMKGKTTILISHRVSTVKDADHILVMDDGEIIEEGTHLELMARQGSYFDTYNRQLSEENNDE